MPAEPTGSGAHQAEPAEFGRLSAIEREADAKFLDVGRGPFTDHGTPTLADASVVLARAAHRHGARRLM